MRPLLLLLFACCAAPPALWSSDELSAEEIADRALETAERAAASNLELRYRWRHQFTSVKPGGGGEVVASSSYRVYPVDGEPFYELVKVDGEPADEDDLRREAKLREKFRSRMGGRDAIVFNRELVSRYELSLEGRRLFRGRPAWVIEFAPREDAPPVNRSVDYALNHSQGWFWIDAEDFGLARIDFALREQVSVWAGVLGSVEVFEGSFVQRRLEPGGWLPERMTLQMEGRALLSSLDQALELDWNDYEPVRDQPVRD